MTEIEVPKNLRIGCVPLGDKTYVVLLSKTSTAPDFVENVFISKQTEDKTRVSANAPIKRMDVEPIKDPKEISAIVTLLKTVKPDFKFYENAFGYEHNTKAIKDLAVKQPMKQ